MYTLLGVFQLTFDFKNNIGFLNDPEQCLLGIFIFTAYISMMLINFCKLR